MVFLLGIVFVLGHVRLYELSLDVEEQESQLRDLLTELGDLRIQRQQQILNLEEYAREMGMYQPSDREYVIVYVDPSEEY